MFPFHEPPPPCPNTPKPYSTFLINFIVLNLLKYFFPPTLLTHKIQNLMKTPNLKLNLTLNFEPCELPLKLHLLP